jgi:hypothetical protein
MASTRAAQPDPETALASGRVSEMARTGQMTWQPQVERLAAALKEAYLDSGKVASLDRIPLGRHAERVGKCLKDLAAVVYFRGSQKERLLDELYDAVVDALARNLAPAQDDHRMGLQGLRDGRLGSAEDPQALQRQREAPLDSRRLSSADYMPDKVLLKEWVRNNLFDLKFSTNKSATPVFDRDLSSPQTEKAVSTAFGASAAIVVAMGSKDGAENATFSQNGGVAQKSLKETTTNFFAALNEFVKRPPASPGDYGVHSEIKNLLDKGFNPKNGGVGRFPKSDDHDEANMAGWSFKKYSSDPKQATATREAHQIHLKQLAYYDRNLVQYLDRAEKDVHVADMLATQLHGTIGQIFNDILFNEGLNREDRQKLFDIMKKANVLPPDIDLPHISKLQTKIRSSPLLMEFNPREVTGQIARQAMESIGRVFGKDAPHAEEILADALARTTTGQMDEIAGLRGRFPKIHEAIAQGINQRDKAIETNCMNMPDARLDNIALDLVPELAGGRGAGAKKLSEQVKSGQIFAHGLRPNTVQRLNTLPANLRKLAADEDKSSVFKRALENERQFVRTSLVEVSAKLEALVAAESQCHSTTFEITRQEELQERIADLKAQADVLRQRLNLVDRLRDHSDALSKASFKDTMVRDFQGGSHALQDLAKENSVAKMIHDAGHRTLCSISGTTTDIGLALVAQYGASRVAQATASLLKRVEALARGDQPLPALDPQFKNLFATLAFFMQGGQYHTPAEVLGGLLIVASSIAMPDKASDKHFMQAAFRNVLKDLADNPAAYLIADLAVAKHFSAKLPEMQKKLSADHRDAITHGKGSSGLKPWRCVPIQPDLLPAGHKPLQAERAARFDDASLPNIGTKKFLINRVRDDFEWRASSGPSSQDEKRALSEKLQQLGQENKAETQHRDFDFRDKYFQKAFGADRQPVRADLTKPSARNPKADLPGLQEPGYTRIRRIEFQTQNLDKLELAGDTPAIRRHEGFRREARLARLRAAERDLAALQARQGKDVTGPVKDALGTLRNADQLAPDLTTNTTDEAAFALAGNALGLPVYGVGMVKGLQKRRDIGHNLKEAQRDLRRYEILNSDIKKSKDYLGRKIANLDRIEGGLAARQADVEAHGRLVAQGAKLPAKDKLEEDISTLRYKRGENNAKLFVRYPAGLVASGAGAATTVGHYAGLAAPAATATLTWVGKAFSVFGAISAVVSGWRIVRNWKENSKIETMIKQADAAIERRRADIAGKIQREALAGGAKGENVRRDKAAIERALAKDSVSLLLLSEKKALQQKIKDNRIDSWGVEFPSLIAGVASVASAVGWLALGVSAVALGPIAIGAGLLGCAVGVGIAIHRLRREGKTQNRMADAQEGLAILQSDPSKLAELRETNPRVKAAAQAIERERGSSPGSATPSAVIEKLEEFLSVRYVNVIAQDVYRQMLDEFEKAELEFGVFPGPDSDPSGVSQNEYVQKILKRMEEGGEPGFPALGTLLGDRKLAPLEISRILYAGSAAEGVKRLLSALNLKEVKTESFTANANLEKTQGSQPASVGLQSGTSELHGNRFESGMNAALVALKRNPSLISKIDLDRKTGQQDDTPLFREFLGRNMHTGTEARELRQEMKAILKQLKASTGDESEPAYRSANECLQLVSGKQGSALRPGQFSSPPPLDSGITKDGTDLLLLDRFDSKGQVVRKVFDPVVPRMNRSKTVTLAPNTIICHQGSERDRGTYITYTRIGHQWYRNASGKAVPVDIRSEAIGAKRKLPQDSMEKRRYDLIHEELYYGCTAVIYGEPNVQLRQAVGDQDNMGLPRVPVDETREEKMPSWSVPQLGGGNANA